MASLVQAAAVNSAASKESSKKDSNQTRPPSKANKSRHPSNGKVSPTTSPATKSPRRPVDKPAHGAAHKKSTRDQRMKEGLRAGRERGNNVSNNASTPTGLRSISPVRRRKPRFASLDDRPSLMERATQSRTSEMISKLVEKNRSHQISAGSPGGGLASPEQGGEEDGDLLNKSSRTGKGIKLLLRITDESNELTRKVERQKRMIERQREQMTDLNRKVDAARKQLRMLQKNEIGGRRTIPKREGYIVRLDALHMRLNDATTRDGDLRASINELRLQQQDNFALQHELRLERQNLKEQRDDILKRIAAAQEREQSYRLEAKEISERSSTVVKDLKEEWDALSIFVNAKTEKERERLWTERKKQELKAYEAEKERQEAATKSLMQLSPFSSVLLKHKPDERGGDDNKSSDKRGIGSVIGNNSGGGNGRRKNSLEAKILRQTLAGGFNMKLIHHDSLNDLALAGNLTVNEEKALKTNIQQSRWQIARGQVALRSLEGKADSLEQGFELIKEKSGIESPAEMVELFLQREEEIFRLFTHVNLLSEQIEELESSVEMEREEIERFKGKDGETSQGRSIVRQLDDRLQRLQRRTALHDEVGLQASKFIDRVKASVASIFVRIGCDTKLIEDFVYQKGIGVPAGTTVSSKHVPEAKPRSRRRFKSPESERAAAEAESISMKQYEITEKNLLQYIGVIEQRVSELLLLHNLVARQKQGENGGQGRQQMNQMNQQQSYHQLPTAQQAHLAIANYESLPSVNKGDEEEWSEDEMDPDSYPRPLSHQELLERIKTQQM